MTKLLVTYDDDKSPLAAILALERVLWATKIIQGIILVTPQPQFRIDAVATSIRELHPGLTIEIAQELTEA